MRRWIAFLRAINIGGHIVKMDHLRLIFELLGFSGVETFIASGNVVFEADNREARVLEKVIQTQLQAALGYEVATFLRTETELAEIVRDQPFTQTNLARAAALNIAFLAEPLDDSSRQKVMALKTEIDDFHVRGREIYWMCLKKQSESTFSNAVLEKTLGRPSTLRGMNTIRRMAEKYVSAKL